MAKAVREEAPTRIVVEKPASIVNAVRSKLARSLKIQNVSLKERKLTHNEIAFVLRGPGEVSITDTQLAVPLNIDAENPYWLGANLTFEPFLGKYALKSVSIKVYRGLATDTKLSILRAEWDTPNSNSTFLHAQPHWHAYPAILQTSQSQPIQSRENAEAITEIPTEIIVEEVPLPTNDISDFHLAMASSWHLPKIGSHQLLLCDEEEVVSWIEGCTRYVIDQLEYLSQ
ncbi:MAG: hypothetical protein ABSD72_04395 [Terracidiphilus sp.]|jgi:hypothetical protein